MVFGGYKDWTSAPEDADLPSFCPIPPFLFASVLLVLQSLFWVRYFESQQFILCVGKLLKKNDTHFAHNHFKCCPRLQFDLKTHKKFYTDFFLMSPLKTNWRIISQKNIFFFRFLPPSIFSPCYALCCLFCVSGRVGNNNLIDVYVSVLRQVGDDVNFSRAHQ